MAYTPLSVLILLGCLAAILGQAVKDSGKEEKPCSEAGLRVKGRNQEAGNWTVRLGDLQAVVQHQDGGGDGEGEWEAALYQKVSDCGEETDQEVPGDDNQDNDDNEIDIDGGVSVTGASVSTTPEITTPQTTKPGTTSPGNEQDHYFGSGSGDGSIGHWDDSGSGSGDESIGSGDDSGSGSGERPIRSWDDTDDTDDYRVHDADLKVPKILRQ